MKLSVSMEWNRSFFGEAVINRRGRSVRRGTMSLEIYRGIYPGMKAVATIQVATAAQKRIILRAFHLVQGALALLLLESYLKAELQEAQPNEKLGFDLVTMLFVLTVLR